MTDERIHDSDYSYTNWIDLNMYIIFFKTIQRKILSYQGNR